MPDSMGMWSPLVRRRERDDEPGLPIKLGPCSNGEFAPRPPSPAVRRAVRVARQTCDEAARRLGMSRRDFLRTTMASAATLLALGACSDDDSPSAGTFDLPPESTTEPEVATSILGGDGQPIVDVQQHLLELDGYQGAFGSTFPQAACGDGQRASTRPTGSTSCSSAPTRRWWCSRPSRCSAIPTPSPPR